MLALIVIVPLLLIGCYIHTLQTENSSYKSHLQSAKNENRQLLDELESIKHTNQQLDNEIKGKEKENDQINGDLQSIKSNNQRLLAENKESQKKIDEIAVELQSVKDSNQKLLEETKEFQKQINQINAELQSTKNSSQEVLKEKIKLLENREVYSTQVSYIQKWMEPIEKLEEHIQAVIYCSESKKKRSKYSKPEMCGKIKYDFEESSTNEIVITAIELIMKFKKECSPFWDALSLKKVEEMKALQDSTPLSSFKSKMEQFNEEASGYKYQKKKEEKVTREHDSDEHQWNKEKGVAKQGIISTIGSVLYGFGKWVGSVIVGLFWS